MAYGGIPSELVDVVPYFMLAYYFGWDKETVDRQDAEFVEKMLIMLKGIIEAEGRQMKDVSKTMRGVKR